MELRRYKEDDCKEVTELFYNTIHLINVRDYSKEQVDAWANGKLDLAKWNQSFLKNYCIVAIDEGKIVGFGDIDDKAYLDHLYVHAAYQGKGIGTAICAALEAKVRGDVLTHSSITARTFFERRGYRLIKEQEVLRDGVWLKNFVMKKNR